ncbi:MAG TPA: hypothetical protein PLH80_05650 [Spirochaetota bacterium]|nr:hypothetical protein [Spirochaetota bacterium]HOF13195.1 hypothetical protein [Spirochaetota bacterium]HOM86645.1 hypothetical protein [Spirochaetota bacterium]HOR93000.1 hypothetical protein [Spirochaetota bacterium]HPD04401.1 hypothetical protein [Spirochaetota bacterium]
MNSKNTSNGIYCIAIILCLHYCACSSGSTVTVKEGCIDNNVLRVVVYVPYSELPQKKLTSDELLTIALQRSEQRYQQIIVNALQLSSGKRDELSPSYSNRTIALKQKRVDGYLIMVDYVLYDEIAQLLQCR